MKEIVNVSRDWAIGRQGQLFVNIPEDMRFFRKTTSGHVCIMGSTTLASFPRSAPLKNRVNIVLVDSDSKISREALQAAKNDRMNGLSTELIYVFSPEEAIETAQRYSERETYVIGGATVYRLMLPYCDTCLVTHNDKPSEGADAFFPDLIASGEWEMTEQSEEYVHEGVRYRFCTYKRIRSIQ